MYRNMATRSSALSVAVLACLAALVIATCSWAATWSASESPEAGCTGSECVLVKSAPAVAVCRIVGSDPVKMKASASAHVKAKKSKTSSVASKHVSPAKSKKAVASKKNTRKQVSSASARKSTSSKNHRSSRTTR